jgi:gliding motility-associated-like protein
MAPLAVCEGDCFELSDLQQQNAEYWQWSFSGLSPDGSTKQTPDEICTTLPGTYELKQVIGYNGCLDSFSLIVEVQPVPNPDLGPDVFQCEGEQFTIAGTTAGATAYLWDDQSTNPIREVTTEGQYTVTVVAGECEGSDAINIRFFEAEYPTGSLDVGSGFTSCEGIPFAISPTVPPGLTYTWDDGVLGSSRDFSTSGEYTLTGSLNGCSLSETVTVLFEDCESKVYLPTAFSPNDDGINDTFQAYGLHFQVESLKVFDRWGGLVYDGKGADAHWDGQGKGRPEQPGVFVYILEYTGLVSGQLKRVSGEVTLVR